MTEHTWQSGFNNGKLGPGFIEGSAAQPPIRCPQCRSRRLYKDGLRYLKDSSTVQRWLCRDCGYRFSETQILNVESSKGSTCQVGAAPLPGRVRNLIKVEPLKDRLAGATKLENENVKGKLVEFSWYMKKQGFKTSTIKTRLDCLKNLVNNGAGPHLLNSEKIKEIIARQPETKWSESYKANITLAYTTFLIANNMTWNPPRYKRSSKLPWIPLESELDQLIMSTGKRISIFLLGLKETACDPGELHAVKWIDVNTHAKTITINYPVKGHRTRILEVSKELIEQLYTLPKTSERIFTAKLVSLRSNFIEQRKRKAKKFNNPRLEKITFTTFRHWKATMEYHKTKDVLWVMKFLGHHSLKSTLVFIDLEKTLFKTANDEFTVKVAADLDEACKLLEVGFEYVTDIDDKKLFRKRK